MAKKVKAWLANDGKLFLDKRECDEYETENMYDIMIKHYEDSIRILRGLKKQRETDMLTGAYSYSGYEEERNRREREALKKCADVSSPPDIQ